MLLGSQANVPRGSLLALAERSADTSRMVTVTVKVLDMPGVKASVMTKQMREFSSQQSELLAAVRGPEDRCNVLARSCYGLFQVHAPRLSAAEGPDG